MKIAYFGTPDFSADFLAKILNDKKLSVQVSFVVTQPDKKKGRNQISTPSPVKMLAGKRGIEVKTRLSADDLEQIDLAVLFAYGEILKKDILSAPKHGFWNIHPSLLPKYRGASPVAAALLNNEKETGVTLMKMDEEVDHGPIIGQKELEIHPKEKRPELTQRLVDLGFDLFKEEIGKFPNNQFSPQDHSQATFTEILKKDDGLVKKEDLTNSPEIVFNKFRAYYPWPGVWTKVTIKDREKRLKLTDLDLKGADLIIKKVQLEGKNEVDFKQFQAAYNISL